LQEDLNSSTGDTAVALLKAGAETDKKDTDGFLAMELAPDAQVKMFRVS
jgi:26S proteasome non-ATPase regulatory subunit 10